MIWTWVVFFGFSAALQSPSQPTLAHPWPAELPPAVSDAFRQAQETGKPMLVSISTNWCGPCIRMRRKTFPDQQVQTELKHWIRLQIDRDQAMQLAEDLGVTGLPTYLLTSGNGYVLDKKTGYIFHEDFVTWLRNTRKQTKRKP